ncbi:hypothetical protein MAGR_67420 [Mycolicibacterium agri]|uniref:Transposase for insertion sequence element IS21-like C-terminal domain-containing protein n=1 Tax=Mycolicibacterium agri TaxID=36811 RepID=A0A7I9WC46_MYCAG|nr:hypothetical protein MAGR_67420 [Mycolicibacterium agri]
MITVRMVKYSVPVRFIGRKVRVSLRANEVVVFDGRTPIAAHPRIAARTGTSVQLDHYLEVLKIKPGAFPGRARWLPPGHRNVHLRSRSVLGSSTARQRRRRGTRELIDVLLLHRSMTEADVVAGIAAALKVGRSAPMWSRWKPAAMARVGPIRAVTFLLTVAPEHRVVSLTQRRLADPAAVIAGLLTDTRPLPSVGAYDELLAQRASSGSTSPTTSPPNEESHVS